MFKLPRLIYGTSSLGNLYEALDFATKHEIVKSCIQQSEGIPVFDCAGKYGAGLALETLGQSLKQLDLKNEEILISNKLGWYRVPLAEGDEPHFEKGVWKDIQHDAIQKISHQGILECFYQGNDLLGGFIPQMVSVHDPDEYLAAADSIKDEEHRFKKILQAYEALNELKAKGEVHSVGIGAKNWRVIQRISPFIRLDWVMIANSLTVHHHPKELRNFILDLHHKGIHVINSAVFNGGFLIGSDYYNYCYVDKASEEGRKLHQWRALFFDLCKKHKLQPAAVCVHFGLRIPGIDSIALNTSKPHHVERNRMLINESIQASFWKDLREAGLIEYVL
ncbi:aldo/keto reductase [Olivibacter sp. CPCC 100613]|uniref:aldo/keto reductase n=1 Tax=Olivibacter sp. CPCC 100613 TaxID=3079931 RepID=UPI002FF83BB9